MDDLIWLMQWHASQCNGAWEHQNGITIETLDNPGWTLKVSLTDTNLETRPFEPQKGAYDHPTAWWVCKVEKKTFVAAGGPQTLPAIIAAFRNWAETE
jgi:hypothetical protein